MFGCSHVKSGFICVVLCLQIQALLSIPNEVRQRTHVHSIVKEGHLTLGGIFSVHEPAISGLCGTKLRDPGVVQYVEAMIYAVNKINDDPNKLGNLKLGYALMDDCAKAEVTLRQSIRFLPIPYKDYFYDVIGVIGAESSPSTIMTAHTLRNFGIPILSPFATSDVFNDRRKYPYVLRMVPSDLYQVKALYSIIRHFEWTILSILYSKGEYGEGSNLQLKNLTSKGNICVALSELIVPDTSVWDLEDIIKKLYEYGSRVVVLFTDQEETKAIFRTVKKLGLANYFVWLGGDGLGLNIDDYDGLEEVTYGSLSLTSYYQAPETGFYTYFESLRPNNTDNPWLKDMWELLFHCNPTDPGCLQNRSISDAAEYTKEITVSSIIDAVNIYAKALESLLNLTCPHVLVDPNKLADCKFNHSHYYSIIKNTTLESKQGHIEFDKYGHVMGKYQILNYQKHPNGTYYAARIGIWEEDTTVLDLNLDEDQWDIQDGHSSVSKCGQDCAKDEIYSYHRDTCCWECRQCKPNERVVDNNSKCEPCPPNEWPDNESLSTCLPLTPQQVSWINPFVLFFVTVSVLGFLFCILVIVLFVIHNSHRLIKATSRELSYIMLVGILLQYIMPGFILAEPTIASCYVTYICFNVSFSIVYAALLTRTNRIFRIFHSGKRTATKPAFISPLSQIVIATIIIFVQILLSVMSAIAVPPEVALQMPRETEPLVQKTCSFHLWGFCVALSYNLLLIMVCSVYAFKTRKLPDNFNESRYIALSVYTTLVIWTVFLPSYFVNHVAFHQVILLCSASLLNATVMLLCLYLPKLYATLQSTDVTKFGYRSPVFQNGSSNECGTHTLETMHTSLRGSVSSNALTCGRNSARQGNNSEPTPTDSLTE